MYDLGLMLTVATLLLVGVTWLTDYFQWRSIRAVDRRLEKADQRYTERGSYGEQFGEWLLSKEAEDKPTNLEACASLVGQQIAGSFSNSMKGIASGESRLVRGVETKIMETLQTPESKALLGFCDQAGIDRNLASLVYGLLEKHGHLSKVLGNDGYVSSGKSGSMKIE